MNQEQLQALAKRLYERRHEGVFVSPAAMSSADWQPKPNRCHWNVGMYLKRYPQHRAVRGWLYDGTEDGVARFIAHSVIETAQGDLVDITPIISPVRFAFIRHEGLEAEFLEMVKGEKSPRVEHFYCEGTREAYSTIPAGPAEDIEPSPGIF